MRRLVFALALLLLLVMGCGESVHRGAPASGGGGPGQTEVRNVTYCAPGGTPLGLDLWLPEARATPAPAVVYFHGGGLESGGRDSGGWLESVRNALVPRGFAVATVSYRLAPEHPWPAQIEDAKCAGRFLRANASRHAVDPGRIGVFGASSGGQLASLVGLAGVPAGWDGGEFGDVSSAVSAVVDLYGPADLTSTDWLESDADIVGRGLGVFGGTLKDLAAASPVSYASAAAPPFLIIQGTEDRTVPPAQSDELYARLTGAGASAEIIRVAGGGHGLSGKELSPSRQEITARIVAFFEAHLG